MKLFSIVFSSYFLFSGCADTKKPFSSFKDCDDCPELVVIPPGSFLMGSDYLERKDEIILDESKGWDLDAIRDSTLFPADMYDEEPKHRVNINYSFAIGKYVITKSQFETYIIETGVEINDCSILTTEGFKVVDSVHWRKPYFETSDDHPIVCVSWKDVQQYLIWLSKKTGEKYRLPSEAEWEYVAKAGNDTKRFFGDNRDFICKYGNVLDLSIYRDRLTRGQDVSKVITFQCDDGYANIAPVYRDIMPNPFSVYEMLGNVFEMVQDRLHFSYQGAPNDGSAWLTGDSQYRVGKGGAYNTVPVFVRPSYKGNLKEDFRLIYLSFRVVREL